MRTNESEYKRLEDTIESLKAENAVLLDEITKLIEDVYYYKEALRKSENIVLTYLKDKERLERERDEAREEAGYMREMIDPWAECDDTSFPWERTTEEAQ
jgi:chromosome segregation ATPase